MSEEQRIIVPESAHWYSVDGVPVEEVPRSTPKKVGVCPECKEQILVTVKGDKSTCPECKKKISVETFQKITTKSVDLTAAKKYGLFPSISRMCSYGEYPIELSNWYKTNFFHFIAERYHPDRDIWLKQVQADIVDWENRYADRGTVVHEWIQRFMEGEDISQADDDCIQRCTQEIEQWLREEMDFTSPVYERAHCDPLQGMGGVIDLEFVSGNKHIIGDYKTKHNPKTFETIKKGNKSYLWSAIKQLAGYMLIHNMYIHEAYVIIVNNETGETLFIQLTDQELSDGKAAIMANALAWKADNKYYPTAMYKNDECWTSEEIVKGQRNANGQN